MVVTERKSPNIFKTPIIQQELEYKKTIFLKNGRKVSLRSINAQDLPKLISFFENLSEDSLFFRYLSINPLIKEREVKRVFKEFARGQLFLVAELNNPDRLIIGISELITRPSHPKEAECAIIIADEWQNKQLGTPMLEWLVEIAKAKDIAVIYGYYNAANRQVSALLRKSGYKYRTKHDHEVIAFQLFLHDPVEK
ncbi:MAG: GNAT family N-acetyltransferase [Candidatus Helarchaeota archaeon]